MKARSLLGLALLGAWAPIVAGGEGKDAVTIDDPTPKAHVACEMDVRGTARLSAGHHLWVLVHRTQGFRSVWWPQTEAEVDPATGRWTAHVVFGGRQDISKEFEIAAIVVGQTEHYALGDYHRLALRNEKWPPIAMPATQGAPVIRTVIKTSHDGCQ